jgi:hypothetical protein
MKTKSVKYLLLATLLFYSGCTTLKRYNCVSSNVTDNSVADVNLFGFRLSDSNPPASGKTLWDLSADAQSQLIKILNNRYTDNDLFREAMNFRYSDNQSDFHPDDYLNKDLRLIFSVSRSHEFLKKSSGGFVISPADRIDYLKITLSLPDGTPFHFRGWNMYSTEYGSIDIGDFSFSRTIDLDASAGLTAGKDNNKAELSAGGKSSATRKEEQKLKYRYLKINGKINSNKIEMEEEGSRETDLAGNIIADVTIEFNGFPETVAVISGLTDSTGKLSDANKLEVRFSEENVPLMETIADTIYAEMRLDYIYRNVAGREKTFPEWDDRIRFINGVVIKKIPVLAARDYVPGFYCIGAENAGKARELISLESPEGKGHKLIFRSYTEAVSFYDWLEWYFRSSRNRKNGLTIGIFSVKCGEKELTESNFSGEHSPEILPYYFGDKFF